MSGSEPARRALTSSALRARQREERAGGSSGLVIQPTTARSKGRYRERRKKKTKKYILARIQALQPVSPPLPPSPTPFYTTHSPSLFSYIPRSSFTSHIHKLPLYALLYLSVSPSRADCERTRTCVREYVVEPMVEKSVPIEKGRRRAASVGGRVAVKKKSKR